jgi:hypothetical protein
MRHSVVLRKPPFWCKCQNDGKAHLTQGHSVNDNFVVKLVHANDKRIKIDCVQQLKKHTFFNIPRQWKNDTKMKKSDGFYIFDKKQTERLQ